MLDVLQDCSQHRPLGVHISADRQPIALPGVRERWQFIEPTLKKTSYLKMVPMVGSLGCPYTCSFCIDAAVPYHPMDFDVLREDLSFLRNQYPSPGSARSRITAKHIISCRSIRDQMIATGRRVRVTIFGKCYFDAENCQDGIQALRHYRYEVNEKLGSLRKEPLHDWASHPADASPTATGQDFQLSLKS